MDLRTERGWSQTELAQRMGLDRTYLNAIEKGRRNVTLKTVLRICQALQVPLADLFRYLDAELIVYFRYPSPE